MTLIHRAIQNILFLAVPLSLLFIVLRAHIVRLLLGSSQFSWDNTRLVAATLAMFSLSVAAQSLVLLFVRGFYATGNTRTPLRINMFIVFLTTGSALLFLYLFKTFPLFAYSIEALLRIEGITGSAVVLLAFAFSLGQIINAILLAIVFHRSMRGVYIPTIPFYQKIFHIVGASLVAALAAYVTIRHALSSFPLFTFWAILS